MDTKTKGNIGEIRIASEFIKWGCTVSFPFGDNARYDLVVDINGELKKVQIKYTDQTTDCDSFTCKCYSSKNHTTNKRLDKYTGDVDFMAFYIVELDQCILFPIDFVGDKGVITVRNTPTKNNQTVGINFVWDHTFDKYFQNIGL